jgi:predicted aspartyl protease
MIRGYFAGPAGRRRPFIEARVAISPAGPRIDLEFLLDTGADRTYLQRRAAERLGIDLEALPTRRSRGVGGTAPAALVGAVLTLGSRHFQIMLRVLMDHDPLQEASQPGVPSVIGGDILAHFGLYIEERRGLVLLLEPPEAEALSFESTGQP